MKNNPMPTLREQFKEKLENHLDECFPKGDDRRGPALLLFGFAIGDFNEMLDEIAQSVEGMESPLKEDLTCDEAKEMSLEDRKFNFRAEWAEENEKLKEQKLTRRQRMTYKRKLKAKWGLKQYTGLSVIFRKIGYNQGLKDAASFLKGESSGGEK